MSAENVAAPAQHKQPSRKGKKAWRKNVDLTQVTEGLDNVRDELIKGGIIAEKPSDELFVLDTAGSTSIQANYQRKNKPLKADQILAERSAIPAIDSRKRAASKTTDGVAEAKRRKTGVSYKEYDRLRSIAYGGDAVQKDVVDVKGAAYDPWSTQEVEDPRFSFIEKAKPVHEPDTLKQAPISLLASGKPIPSVRKPQAGKSYNPTFEDWDKLVTKAGQKEVEAELKRRAEQRAEEERLARIQAIAEESDDVQTEGESAWESEWEGIESDAEEAQRLNQKRPERKTQAERNKIKRRKEAERKALEEKKNREKERQLAKAKALAKAAAEKEAAKKNALVKIDSNNESSEDDDDEEEVLRRRRLGKIHVPEGPLEVVLADELKDSLRALKPEGNLLKDRFRSMQLQGRIETRKQISMPRKRQRMYTEKWTYKDWKLR